MSSDPKLQRVTAAVAGYVQAKELMATVNVLTDAAEVDPAQAEIISLLISSLASPLQRRTVDVAAVRNWILELAEW